MWVGWSEVTGSYQGRISGVPGVCADSDLMPLLSLWPFTKISYHMEASLAYLGPVDPWVLFKKCFSLDCDWLPATWIVSGSALAKALLLLKKPPGKFLHNGSDSNSFRYYGPYGLCHNYLALYCSTKLAKYNV